jgi:hypothetical protein
MSLAFQTDLLLCMLESHLRTFLNSLVVCSEVVPSFFFIVEQEKNFSLTSVYPLVVGVSIKSKIWLYLIFELRVRAIDF